MPSNLLLRGRNHSLRLFIPTDPREHVGRTEIVKSLTRDWRHAKMLLRRLQHAVERLFFCAWLYARLGVVDKATSPAQEITMEREAQGDQHRA